MNPLIRLGGWAALLGGALRVIATFIPYTPGSPALEAFYTVIDANLLLGLIGIYSLLADSIGRPGLTGFVVASIGQGSIIGPDATQFGVDFYLAGSLTLLAGLTMLSTAMWQAKVMRPAAASWLLATGLAGASTMLGEGAALAAGAALGMGFAWAGAAVLKQPLIAAAR